MQRSYFLICIFLTVFSFGQDPSPEIQARTEKNELCIGANFNTHASIIGGFNLSYFYQKTELKSNGFLIELVNIKHPKEFRVTVGRSNSGTFVLEKYNHLFSIRTLYAKRFLLFHKSSDEGVELALNTSGGIAWGLQKPTYVYLQNDSLLGTGYFKYQQVGTRSSIVGGGGLFRGLNESKVIPGASFRLSGTFEFSLFAENPIGIELGTQIDTYAKSINIISYEPPKRSFVTAFFVIYTGIRW